VIRSAATAVFIVLALAACSSDEGTATGIVIDVDGDLTAVESFTILNEDGECRFVPAEGLTFHGSPLSHLSSHVVSGEPVTVEYETGDDGTKIATEVHDSG
jgi:hypothetical protein